VEEGAVAVAVAAGRAAVTVGVTVAVGVGKRDAVCASVAVDGLRDSMSSTGTSSGTVTVSTCEAGCQAKSNSGGEGGCDDESGVGLINRRVAGVDGCGCGTKSGDALGQDRQRFVAERADGVDDERGAIGDGKICRANHHGCGFAGGDNASGNGSGAKISCTFLTVEDVGERHTAVCGDVNRGRCRSVTHNQTAAACGDGGGVVLEHGESGVAVRVEVSDDGVVAGAGQGYVTCIDCDGVCSGDLDLQVGERLASQSREVLGVAKCESYEDVAAARLHVNVNTGDAVKQVDACALSARRLGGEGNGCAQESNNGCENGYKLAHGNAFQWVKCCGVFRRPGPIRMHEIGVLGKENISSVECICGGVDGRRCW